MFPNDFSSSIHRQTPAQDRDRRGKYRFPMQRELRYKLLRDGATVESGSGQTVDVGSGGVAFSIGRELEPGSYIELSISWPVLLEHSCPMQLIAFGRVVRNLDGKCACTIDKYEFRTQARVVQAPAVRNDSRLERWADAMRKDFSANLKPRMLSA
jgi:hypothetical protein